MMNAQAAVSDHPGGMDDDALATAVATLSAHIHVATSRLPVLIAELDRRKLWAAQGAMSCAHWHSWACGIDAHTAREKVRVARALEDLPLLSESLAKGELGYSKVRALTHVATAGNEANLLEIGLHGTAGHVEKFVRLYRQATRANETERADARHRERGLALWHEDDGTLVPHGRFPPEMAARIVNGLEAAMSAHAAEQPAAEWSQEHAAGSAPDVPRGTSLPKPPVAVRRADALAWMAERLFEPGEAPALAPDGHEIVVHVDAEVLVGGGTGRCEIEHHSAIAGETARRLCCDAGIVAAVDGPVGEPLAVGRRTRAIPPAMRRALLIRDRECRFPGCPSTHRLHGHHVRHWARGGETSLDNLVLLCPFHHRLVHEGGFDVHRLDDGVFRFVSPHGWTVRPPQPSCASSPDLIVRRNEALGLPIDGRTATARWDGERVDYDQGVMLAMASWETGDSRAGAGAEAADVSAP